MTILIPSWHLPQLNTWKASERHQGVGGGRKAGEFLLLQVWDWKESQEGGEAVAAEKKRPGSLRL